MLHSNLLCLKGTNLTGNINKNLLNNSILIQISLRDKGLGGQFIGLLLIDIDHNHNRILTILGK